MVKYVAAASIIAVCCLATGCRNSDGDSPTSDPNGPVVTISEPTVLTTFATGCASVRLAGTAGINESSYRCCPAEDDTTMSWSNARTGLGGTLSSEIQVLFVVAIRNWSRNISLDPGPNSITISETYVGGAMASDTITVTRDDSLFCPP